jgi:hypothetical protein
MWIKHPTARTLITLGLSDSSQSSDVRTLITVGLVM